MWARTIWFVRPTYAQPCDRRERGVLLSGSAVAPDGGRRHWPLKTEAAAVMPKGEAK
jgi:hypothetical protein